MTRLAALAACALAMGAGMWVDTRSVSLDALAAACATAESPWEAMVRHGGALPASHALMAAVGASLPAGWGHRTAHAAAMVFGMAAFALLGPLLSRLSGLSGGEAMTLAMVAGMAVSARLLPSQPSAPKPPARPSRK